MTAEIQPIQKDSAALCCPSCATNERRVVLIARLASLLKLGLQLAMPHEDTSMLESAQRLADRIAKLAHQDREDLPEIERQLQGAEDDIAAASTEVTRFVNARMGGRPFVW